MQSHNLNFGGSALANIEVIGFWIILMIKSYNQRIIEYIYISINNIWIKENILLKINKY